MATSQIHSITALVVDPELESRMRLKAATASAHRFGKVVLANSYGEGLARITESEGFDVIFLTHSLGESEIQNFIAESKKSEQGSTSAYVLVLKTAKQDTSTVASSMVSGADGFLCEPYSVDVLLEMAELAERVKGERQSARKEAAAVMLFDKVGKEISNIALKISLGKADFKSMKDMKNLGKTIQGLELDSLESYERAILKAFDDKAPPPQLPSKYRGASSRVKKLVDEIGQKALNDLMGVPNEEAPKENAADKRPDSGRPQYIIRKR